MHINIEDIRKSQVVGFEYDYQLNDKLTVSLLGDVPGGIAIQISKYNGTDKDTVDQIVIPHQHVDTFIGFCQIAWSQLRQDRENWKKYQSEG